MPKIKNYKAELFCWQVLLLIGWTYCLFFTQGGNVVLALS